MILSRLKERHLHTQREINHITVRSPRITRSLTLAVAADMHDGYFEDVLPALAQCDAILIPGDLVDRHSGGFDRAVRFLQAAPGQALASSSSRKDCTATSASVTKSAWPPFS